MLKLLKKLKTAEWIMVVISVILIALQVWLDLKMPDYMSNITVLEELRKSLFNKVEEMSMDDVKSFKTSSLITRTTNDVTQIQMFISMGLQLLIKAPITAVWAVTKILNKNWEWSLLTGIAVLVLLFTIGILIIVVLPRFKKVQELTDNINGVMRENLTGIRVVRAFNAEKYQEDKFENVNNKLTKLQLFNQKTFGNFIWRHGSIFIICYASNNVILNVSNDIYDITKSRSISS